MEDDQQFCLRWNNHQSTLVSVFDNLLEKGIHVDCTLAAEGQTLKAHKVVLSACSPYFENVLSQQYDKHPIIILKDVKYAELRAMMDYMYRGEVNISQDQLAALLKAAESLQIKGLSDNKPSRPPSRPAPPAPRAASPPPQVRDGSVESRSSSASPTRRRKRARRASTEPPLSTTLEPAPAVPAAGVVNAPNNVAGSPTEPPRCKDERPALEDLTLDEDNDDSPIVKHNDVVRNFQWHMERSQDEIMNSSDSIRDSQGAGRGIVTRSRKAADEPAAAKTFAILQPRKKSASLARDDDAKENKTRAAAPPAPPPAPPAAPKLEPEYLGSSPCTGLPLKEKGFKCQNCQRSYNARRNLVRHLTLECGREPMFKCPHCSYRQYRRNELKKHIEKKHSNVPPMSPRSPSPARSLH